MNGDKVPLGRCCYKNLIAPVDPTVSGPQLLCPGDYESLKLSSLRASSNRVSPIILNEHTASAGAKDASRSYPFRDSPPKTVPHSAGNSLPEFSRKQHFGLETVRRKVLGIEGDKEVCLARFGAQTKCVVLGVGRNLRREAHFDLLGSFSNQVNDGPDEV